MIDVTEGPDNRAVRAAPIRLPAMIALMRDDRFAG